MRLEGKRWRENLGATRGNAEALKERREAGVRAALGKMMIGALPLPKGFLGIRPLFPSFYIFLEKNRLLLVVNLSQNMRRAAST